MSDILGTLEVSQVAAFYRRLAKNVESNKGDLKTSLAADFMNHWLDNRDPASTYSFDAPAHLREHVQTQEALRYHRAVYLTEKQARLGKNIRKWAGALPRLQDNRWDGNSILNMDYQSLVELPLRYQVTGSDADRDLLYALHGFQLKSKVSLRPSKIHGSSNLQVEFVAFSAQVIDRYDWDYTERLKVPNPDYNSSASNAVTPDSKYVQVYHSNAKRLEDAKLAAPYEIRTNFWLVANASLKMPAELDRSRRL